MPSRSSSGRGDFDSFLRNLRQERSLAWKVRRYVANMLIRVRRGSSCCGNDGEPGC
jgi:hypothetical protein